MHGAQNEINRLQNQGMTNNTQYSNIYVPSSRYPNIVIYYPGKKGIKDYRLEFNGKTISHPDIARSFYSLSNIYSQELIDFIVDIYTNGLSATYSKKLPSTINVLGHNITFDEFKFLIYFTILQEEINYPQPRFQGTKMPSHRFIEAVVSSVQPQIITFDEVVSRINNHGRGVPVTIKNKPGLNQNFINALNAI
ncbi:hypothetical protein JZO82_12520 [Vagococcus fluvialis]|uniref:hypothetical protein n=1 Tax=Vagococcus fluvialis TaxID=2738 RepID=UPI001A8E2512|nr:hypothetical protein [Vagococcus fluvialis]MBO0429992.1 hypothetical protein [Vagococcus fluvialis]